MTSQDADLQRARDELEAAVKTADDDVRDDLRDVAAAFSALTTTDRDADHATFDAHLNTLRQAGTDATGETADRLEVALEHAESYRTGLEQA
ncbi:DUF7553 family protein [Natronosalvus vescus]|uniref:DUF7553 family protein n=1 Tax=Natronosalvus vescus TaxID=2953881 RepID=UPI002091DA86|nr:hypothetical protein [Natronosalvus vescus]